MKMIAEIIGLIAAAYGLYSIINYLIPEPVPGGNSAPPQTTPAAPPQTTPGAPTAQAPANSGYPAWFNVDADMGAIFKWLNTGGPEPTNY